MELDYVWRRGRIINQDTVGSCTDYLVSQDGSTSRQVLPILQEQAVSQAGPLSAISRGLCLIMQLPQVEVQPRCPRRQDPYL